MNNTMTLVPALLAQIVYAGVLVSLLFILQEALLTTITVASLLLIVVRFTLLRFGARGFYQLASARTKNLGASLFFLLVMVNLGQVGVLNAMVNLLMSGAALWWFTLPSHQLQLTGADERLDHHIAPIYVRACQNLFLCLTFLIAVSFIYQQRLVDFALYMLLMLANMLALLLITSPQINSRRASVLVMKTTLIAAPLVALMFVVLPNLPPFWKLPEQRQAQTGLSDSMTPGDISNLAQSERLAFRAAFNQSNSPPVANMYWRAFTMEQFDGRRWQLAERRKRQISPRRGRGVTPDYSIVMEPTEQQWLVSFGPSVSADDLIEHREDDTFWRRKPVSQRTRYFASQLDSAGVRELPPWEREINLEVEQPSQQIDQLLSSWRGSPERVLSPEQIAEQVLEYFREQNFSYTLSPPRLAGHHIDSFLFATKQGFCAHFAGAFVVMMRQAGIPARVVTGYHGGLYNAQGDYFEVYDAQAHAWAEYWIEGSQGGRWQRVDPTSAVAPQRILQGQIPVEESDNALLTQPLEYMQSLPWLNNLSQYLSSLDYYWTVWILDFDQAQRSDLWNSVKNFEIRWSQLVLPMLLVMSALVAMYIFVARVRFYLKTTYEQRALIRLQKVCNQALSKAEVKQGTVMRKTDTLAEYIGRICDMLPEKSSQLGVIKHDLELLLYSKLPKTEKENRRKTLNSNLKKLSL